MAFAQTSSSLALPPTTPHPPRGDISVYGRFFLHINLLNAEVERAERHGMNSHYLRRYLQIEANLSPTQANLLNETAANLATQLADYDARSAELRTQRHVLVQTKRRNNEPIPPVPAALLKLQGGRDALILQARERIRLNMGDQEFARLDAYVRSGSPWDRPIIPPPPGQPAPPPSSAPTAGNGQNRFYYQALFHTLAAFKRRAEEERKLGLDDVAASLATLVQRQSGLSPAEFQFVEQAVDRYLKAREAGARQVEAARVPYEKLALEMLARDGKLTANPQLTATYAPLRSVPRQMDQSAMETVKQLQSDLGEEAFGRLNAFVNARFAPKPKQEAGR